jgi:hypothetical protein
MPASAGVFLAQTSRGSRSNVTSFEDVAEARAKRAMMPANDGVDDGHPEPDVGGKWPAWKVTTMVVLFCGAFWAGLFWVAMRLFG